MPSETTQFSADDQKEMWRLDNPTLKGISRTTRDAGNYEIAELATRMLLRRSTDDVRIYISLAIILECQEKYKEALDQRLAVKMMTPNDEENLTRMEFLRLKIASVKKRRMGKKTMYEKFCAADLTALSAAQLEYAMKEAVSLRDDQNLLRFTEEFIRQRPGDMFGHSYRAIALERLGEFQEALTARERCADMLITSRSKEINGAAIARLQEKIQATARKVIT